WVNLAVLGVVLILTWVLAHYIPMGFLPNEDNSQILAFTEAAEGISFDSLVEHQKALMAIVRREPGVEAFFSSAGARGITSSNSGIIFMHLKPPKERPPIEDMVQELRP